MYILGRKLVLLLVMILSQSTLGTKADLVNSKNLGQNGYKKFEDGWLVQWGYSTSGGSGTTRYFPINFYDSNFSITFASNSTSRLGTITVMINSINKSYFNTESRYNDAQQVSTAGEGFRWIAIGRWK